MNAEELKDLLMAWEWGKGLPSDWAEHIKKSSSLKDCERIFLCFMATSIASSFKNKQPCDYCTNYSYNAFKIGMKYSSNVRIDYNKKWIHFSGFIKVNDIDPNTYWGVVLMYGEKFPTKKINSIDQLNIELNKFRK